MKKILFFAVGLIFFFVMLSNFVFADSVVGLTATYTSGPFSGSAVPLTSNNAGTAYDQGVEPNSDITLTAIYNGDVQTACDAYNQGHHLYRTVIHYKDGNPDNKLESNIDFQASGQATSANFSYKFNSGPATQNNTYRAMFYCWSSSVPTQALSDTVTVVKWGSPYFIGKAAGAPCSFNSVDWSKTSATTGETITMTTTTDDQWCRGLSFDFEIWRGSSNAWGVGNQTDAVIKGTFSTGSTLPLVVQKNWAPSIASQYGFRIKLADGSCARMANGNCLWSQALTVTGSDVTCTITPAWEKSSVKAGETVNGKVTGTSTCAGKDVTMDVATSAGVKTTMTGTFPASGTQVITKSYTPSTNGTYFISAKLGTSGTPVKSGNLIVGDNGGTEVVFTNPGTNDTVIALLKSVLNWMITVAIPIAILVILYAGFIFLTKQGIPKRIDEAKKILTWAVLGLAVILIGSGFISLIQSIINLAN